jgi:hypothetical protein
MQEIDALYARLLQVGFIVLRQAVECGDADWIKAEIEFLHNLPSLMSDPNPERHRYFWFSERDHYIQWVSAPGRDKPKSRMSTFYEPVWRDMEPLVMRLLGKDKREDCSGPTSPDSQQDGEPDPEE